MMKSSFERTIMVIHLLWVGFVLAVVVANCVSVPKIEVEPAIEAVVEAKPRATIADRSSEITPELNAGRDAMSYMFQFGGWGCMALSTVVGLLVGRRGKQHKNFGMELMNVRDALMEAVEAEGATSVKHYMKLYPDFGVRMHVAKRNKEINGDNR